MVKIMRAVFCTLHCTVLTADTIKQCSEKIVVFLCSFTAIDSKFCWVRHWNFLSNHLEF